MIKLSKPFLKRFFSFCSEKGFYSFICKKKRKEKGKEGSKEMQHNTQERKRIKQTKKRGKSKEFMFRRTDAWMKEVKYNDCRSLIFNLYKKD